MPQLLIQLINHEPVYRTALATTGLLKTTSNYVAALSIVGVSVFYFTCSFCELLLIFGNIFHFCFSPRNNVCMSQTIYANHIPSFCVLLISFLSCPP